jgi:uncharacterized protein DUF2490
MRRWAAALLVLALAGSEVHAQNGGERLEFWPELQFRYRVDEATSLTLQSRLQATTVNTGPAAGLYRAEEIVSADRRFIDWFSAGLAFEQRNATNGRPFWEERLSPNQTLYVLLPDRFGVDFRTEENFRWLPSGFSVRLRERVRLHRATEIGGYGFTPFAWTEVFWDSRFGAFSRYRLGVGAELPVYRALRLQPYFMRQVNYEGADTIQDIVGTAVITSF